MIGRTPPEWIGRTADTPIPDHVKLRIWDRERGICYLTGRKLRAGEYDFEHVIALANWTGEGHGNRESNIRLAYRPAHREKTKQDRKAKTDSDRVRKKHVGIRPPSKMRSRGFDKAPPQHTATRPIRRKELT
jgi:5-methylcytosine-specific restriction endonuclease McrA